jgi:hypothetical protein
MPRRIIRQCSHPFTDECRFFGDLVNRVFFEDLFEGKENQRIFFYFEKTYVCKVDGKLGPYSSFRAASFF